MNGCCKLCGNTAKLVKAHIIPKSLYKVLRGSTGSVIKIITNTAGVHPKRIPMGIYDPNIVCEDCEKLFSPWDDYAKWFFEKNTPKVISNKGRVVAYDYGIPDYQKLKLFFVSLLWRAHASQLPFFRMVELGKHETDVVNKIRSSDPGNSDEYSIILARFNHQLAEVIQNPFRSRIFGINCYRFYLPSYFFVIKFDKRPFPDGFREVMLQPGVNFHALAKDFTVSKEMRLLKKMAEKKWGIVTKV